MKLPPNSIWREWVFVGSPAPIAKVKAKEEWAFCHIARAKKDEVWAQFYCLFSDGPFSVSIDRHVYVTINPRGSF